jgi:hypothetical protein
MSGDPPPLSDQTWVTAVAVETTRPDPSRLAGFAVDTPRAGDRSRGAGLEINGWAIGGGDPVRAVRVTRDGIPGRPVPLDVLRSDVASDYPDFPFARVSGFSIWAPLDPGDHDVSLTVESLLADGEPVTLARIDLKISHEEATPESGSRVVDAPDFVIIGAQRGGTTSLHAYLRAHPQIILPATKELHYLTDRFGRGREWYLGQFPSPLAAGLLTGEATPYAMFHPLAPGRLRAVAPRAKLIVLLRDPVDRAYSHYLMERARGDEALEFAAALAAEPTRLAREEARLVADPEYVSWPHKHASYLARGDYTPQLERWFACFPRHQILILRSEDFYRQTAGTFADITAFLGLDPDTSIPFVVHNRAEGSPLDPTLRDRLRTYFAPKNAALAALLGWDPSWPQSPWTPASHLPIPLP